jgi:hypothetical protein
MVKVGNLPLGIRVLQFLLEPRDLLRVQVRTFEREEPDALFRRLEGIIEFAVHVEEFVVPLFARVVVAE